jgi:hypothetical protein
MGAPRFRTRATLDREKDKTMHQVSFQIGVAAARLNLSNGQLLGLARECAEDWGILSLAQLTTEQQRNLLDFLWHATADEIANKLTRKRANDAVDRRAELIGA